MASRSVKSRTKGSTAQSDHISSVLQEHRAFAPSDEFRSRAHVSSARQLSTLRQQAESDPVVFWEDRARELTWFRHWKRALVWKHPHAQWFVGGATNAAMNCLDRHLGGWRRTKAALIWEGEPGDV
ncbi:MAG: hypothetical protein RIR53_1498, partial [Bacteroidota bacterium]